MSKDSLLLQPIKVGNLTLKNRIMFPPLTTGYEERDGSIGARSLAFYERLDYNMSCSLREQDMRLQLSWQST